MSMYEAGCGLGDIAREVDDQVEGYTLGHLLGIIEGCVIGIILCEVDGCISRGVEGWGGGRGKICIL